MALCISVRRAVRPAFVAWALLALAGCQSTGPTPMPATPPQGSITPQTLGPLTKDDEYWLSHAYVREATAWGNLGFARLDADRPQEAGEAFRRSDEAMAEGIANHVRLASKRQANQELAVDMLSAGLAIAGALAAGQDGVYRPELIDQMTRTNLQLNAMLKNDLVQQVRDGTAETRLDRDQWRAIVVSDARVARAIVRVENQTRHTSCTGFFIAPQIVATAAHCFELGDAIGLRRLTPWDPEAFMTETGAFMLADLQVRPGDYQPVKALATERSHGFDVALLATQAPSDAWLPVSDALPPAGERLAVVGFSGDLNSGFFLRIDYGCEVKAVDRYEILETDCETWKGNSGGPVLSTRGGLHVVGVHSRARADREPDGRSRGFAPSTRRLVQLYDLARGVEGWAARMGDFALSR